MKIAFYAVVIIVGCWFALHAYDASHVGAPPLHIDCPSHTHETTWWVKDSDPTGRGASGTLEWHGYREIASCSSSITAGT